MNLSKNAERNGVYYGIEEGNSKILSDRMYNIIIGGCLLWGFFFNALIVVNLTEWALSLNFWVVIIGYIVSCVAGVTIYSKSQKAMVSFIGYNLIVLPIGVLLTYFLYDINQFVVFQAIVTTGGVTLIMMLAASIFPRFFAKLGGTLFIALIGVVIVELLLSFIFKIHPTVMDWAVATIFCGYIGYDWVLANGMDKTADNAVDGAAKLYLDIINLFIRILSIISRRNS